MVGFILTRLARKTQFITLIVFFKCLFLSPVSGLENPVSSPNHLVAALCRTTPLLKGCSAPDLSPVDPREKIEQQTPVNKVDVAIATAAPVATSFKRGATSSLHHLVTKVYILFSSFSQLLHHHLTNSFITILKQNLLTSSFSSLDSPVVPAASCI